MNEISVKMFLVNFMKHTILILSIGLIIFKSYSQGESIELLKIESTSDFSIKSTCVDSNNNIYFTGYYSDSVFFPSDTLINPDNNPHIFICKLDSVGNLIWSITDTSSGQQKGLLIKPDMFGNLIIMGSSDGNYIFDSIPAGNLYNHFIAKINSTGELQWATCFYATYFQHPRDIAIDNNGKIYITGYFSHALYLGNYTLTSTNYYGGDEIFLAKLDSTGTFVWAKKAGTNQQSNYLDDDKSFAICVDNNHDIYIAGCFKEACSFPSTILETTGRDIFVAKYNSLGDNLWAKQANRHSGDNWAVFLNYNSDNTIDLFGRIRYNGLFFGDSINLGNKTEYFLANFTKDLDKNWVQLIDGNFQNYFIIPRNEIINSDPLTSFKYYLTEIYDTVGNYISDGFCLLNLDANGNLRYVKNLSENNSTGLSVQSLTINYSHESIIKCTIEDTVTIGNITYTPGSESLHLIFKITKPGSTIKGKVFDDIDGNGVINIGEQGILNVLIQIENENISLVTDTGGYYNFYCDTGYYKVSIIVDSLCEQTHPTNPFYYSFDILTDSTIIDNSDFGIYCSDSTGIFDLEFREIAIYPNPSNGRFTVDLDDFEDIEIRDILGQVVYTTKQKEIDIRSEPAGIYIILITDDKTIYRGEIIKK